MPVWEVEVTDEVVEWWNGLTVDQQESLTDRVDLLAERGPTTSTTLTWPNCAMRG